MSTGSLSRARKNAKLVADGEDALEDNSTDYGQPRKRKKPVKFRDDDDDCSVDIPSSPKKIRRRVPKLQSESEDSDQCIPGPNTDMDALQMKVDRAIARRQVEVPKKTETKTKLTAKRVISPLKISTRDSIARKGESISVHGFYVRLLSKK